jgi:tetratricopeptide (TPR) repeat protein
VLSSLRRTAATGNLQLTAAAGVRQLVFVDGELRAARSSVESEKLGSWLVERGAISEDRKALSLLLQIKEPASPLGHILTTRENLPQQVLEWEIESLATTIIERATTEDRLEIVFFEGGTGIQEDTLLNTSTPQLILASARAFPDLRAKRRYLGSASHHVSLEVPLEAVLNDLALAPAETSILMTLQQGSVTLSELTSYGSEDKETLLAAIYGLTVAGVLRVGRQPAAPLSPAEPVASRTAEPEAATTTTPAIHEVLQRVEETLSLGNVPEALTILERACDEDSHPVLLVRLAQLMMRHHVQPEKALEVLRKALETDPRMVEGWLELAHFWRRNEHRERERKALERVLFLDPDHFEAKPRHADLTGDRD